MTGNRRNLGALLPNSLIIEALTVSLLWRIKEPARHQAMLSLL